MENQYYAYCSAARDNYTIIEAMNILSIIPSVIISKVIGILVNIPAPQFIWLPIISWYATQYRVNLEEAEFPLEHYKTLGEFFVRNLKPGLRPIGEGIVSPVDGTLRNYGVVSGERLPQIKGRSYSIKDLAGESELAQRLQGGTFFNLYLSPKDYHHIHAPFDGQIRSVIYRPGRLLPVNDFSMSRVENLFGTNERVTIVIRDATGRDSLMTLVGALNVGKIELTFDQQLSSRISASPFASQGFTHHYQAGEKRCLKGERVGTFHLGSSVALILAPGVFPSQSIDQVERTAKMGQELAVLVDQNV